MQQLDAPQADRLDFVRRAVEAIAAGAHNAAEVAASVPLAPRYARYALHAGRLLGLLAEDPPQLTELGSRLLATQRGSETERELLRSALRTSTATSPLAPAILGADEPSRIALAEELLRVQAMALSTALRRAGTLLAWRRYLMPQADGPQLRFEELEWTPEADASAPPIPLTEVGMHPATDVAALRDDVELSEPETPSAQDLAAELEEQSSASHVDHPLPDAIEPPPTSTELPADVVESSTRSATEPSVPSEGSGRDEPTALLDEYQAAYLRRQIEHGAVMLFTGAGFSLGASDVNGKRLPTGPGFACELWELCYPGEDYDGSSIQDVFEQAQRYHRRALEELLNARFTIDSASLPDWYQVWYSFPWAKVYTVNVDDLESAVQRRFDVPRSLRTVSALKDAHATATSGLDVIHLNGVASDGADGVTFSVDQFAMRQARQEPFYAQLAAEMLTRPFIFVGSPVDEPLFWQHVQMRGMRSRHSESELRPRSFLVSPTLNRARAGKLGAYNVVWIRATAQDFVGQVLEPLRDAAERGHAGLRVLAAADSGDERNIVEVADVATQAERGTAFLLGEEASWADIRTGRAVARDEDRERMERLRELALASRPASEPVPIVAIVGTAGAGKTTLLMKIGLQLHAQGVRTAWVAAASEVHPRALTRYYRAESPPPVLVLDDAGRYGAQLVPLLTDVVRSDAVRLVVIGLRSHHEARLDATGAQVLRIEKEYIGPLTDGDIGRLLDALEKEKRLGDLRGKSPEQRHATFRERADRQILVAMIEATSGERFEDKIVREWQDQDSTERYVYALAALATAHGYPLLLQEFLLASSGGPAEMDAVRRLHRSHLLAYDDGQRYRVRHRVIAEKLIDELASRGTQLAQLVVGLCRALASPPRASRRRRILKHLLSHDRLLRLLNDVDAARSVYEQLQDYLDDDHHFWLQRGCLELEEGDVRFAQNFLEQAAAINGTDPLVETACAHMQLRKAIANPGSSESEGLVEEALATLRRLVTSRGRLDHYPAHVFGSQVLAWCRRAALVPRVRSALLREAKEIVGEAMRHHRSRRELRQLHDDLRREELTPR